jgi:thymidine kinase
MNNIIEVGAIKTDEVAEITQDCEKILQTSEVLSIKNQLDFDNANSILKAVKGKIKTLEESRKTITSPLMLAKKRVDDLYKIPMSMLEKAEGFIKQGMIVFSEKVEADRRKQEEKLRKEMELKAQKAEAKGNSEKAEEIRQQAELTTVASTIEKPKGLQCRDLWKYKIVDEAAIERQYLTPNHDMLSKMAVATKGSIVVKGVQFYSEKIIVSR